MVEIECFSGKYHKSTQLRLFLFCDSFDRRKWDLEKSVRGVCSVET